MKKELTFNTAYERLKKLVNEMEDENIQLDKLDKKVSEANELIQFCETNLRNIEIAVDKAAKSPITKKKKKKEEE